MIWGISRWRSSPPTRWIPTWSPGAGRSAPSAGSTGGWIVLQHEMTASSADSTHVVAEYGGHHLNYDDNPELVVQAIADLVRRVRFRAVTSLTS